MANENKNIDDLKKDSLSDQVKNRLNESVTAIKDEISKSGALGVGLLSLGSYSAGSLMGDDKENKRGSGFNEDDEDGYKDGGKVNNRRSKMARGRRAPRRGTAPARRRGGRTTGVRKFGHGGMIRELKNQRGTI